MLNDDLRAFGVPDKTAVYVTGTLLGGYSLDLSFTNVDNESSSQVVLDTLRELGHVEIYGLRNIFLVFNYPGNFASFYINTSNTRSLQVGFYSTQPDRVKFYHVSLVPAHYLIDSYSFDNIVTGVDYLKRFSKLRDITQNFGWKFGEHFIAHMFSTILLVYFLSYYMSWGLPTSSLGTLNIFRKNYIKRDSQDRLLTYSFVVVSPYTEFQESDIDYSFKVDTTHLGTRITSVFRSPCTNIYLKQLVNNHVSDNSPHKEFRAFDMSIDTLFPTNLQDFNTFINDSAVKSFSWDLYRHLVSAHLFTQINRIFQDIWGVKMLFHGGSEDTGPNHLHVAFVKDFYGIESQYKPGF